MSFVTKLINIFNDNQNGEEQTLTCSSKKNHVPTYNTYMSEIVISWQDYKLIESDEFHFDDGDELFVLSTPFCMMVYNRQENTYTYSVNISASTEYVAAGTLIMMRTIADVDGLYEVNNDNRIKIKFGPPYILTEDGTIFAGDPAKEYKRLYDEMGILSKFNLKEIINDPGNTGFDNGLSGLS